MREKNIPQQFQMNKVKKMPTRFFLCLCHRCWLQMKIILTDVGSGSSVVISTTRVTRYAKKFHTSELMKLWNVMALFVFVNECLAIKSLLRRQDRYSSCSFGCKTIYTVWHKKMLLRELPY